MKLWHLLLEQGNYRFNQQQWSEAEELYHQAIECLEHHWQKNYDESLLLPWVSAFHNLAMLYEEQGKAKVALQYLKIPHQRMIELSNAEEASESVQWLATRTLQITIAPLVSFSKKYHACESCRESLNREVVQADALQPILH